MGDKVKLLNILEDLKEDEFKKFKWHLRELPGGYPVIPNSDLEKADRCDTVDKIIDAYSDQSVEVVKKTLEKINKKDLAEKLPNTDAGAHDGPSPKLLHTITSYQTRLQSNLQDPFMCIQEGWTTKKDEKNLEKIFTDLNHTAAGGAHTTTQLQVQMSNIFKDPSRKEKNIRTVLTSGIAGSGKTFLVHKFVLDWADKRTNQDVHLMFPFTFSSLNSQREKGKKNFVKLIHTCILETNHIKQEDLHNIFSTLQKTGNRNFNKSEYKLLFVLDGLDESRLQLDFSDDDNLPIDVRESTSVDLLLTNLIKGTLLPSARLWITTRPAAANQIPPEYVDMVTEVRGFTDPQKEEFFRKRFEDEEPASSIILHIKTSQSLNFMCHIPVFCWITATLLEGVLKSREGELPKTLTEMYTEFLMSQITHLEEKRGREKSLQFIKTLTKLAFKQLEQRSLMFFCEEDLKDGSTESGEVLYSQVFSRIFKEKHQKMFSFVHWSIVEFLAALYVVLSPMTQRNIIDKAIQSPHGHMDLFLRFLLGLSVQTNQTLLQGLLTETGSNFQTSQLIVNYVKKKIRENPSSDRKISLSYCLNDSPVEETQQYLRSGSLSSDEPFPVVSSGGGSHYTLETHSTTDEDIISKRSLISSGSPAVYQPTLNDKKFGTRMTLGTKNTHEIAVYRKLEVQYGNWTWTLRSNMLTIENQLHTRIENGKLDNVELGYLFKEMSETYEDIKKEMTTFFDDDKDKEMLVQWRGRFEIKIKEFHEEQVRGVKRKLDEVIQQKKARKKSDDMKTEFEKKLLQKSKELAQKLKDKTKDEEKLQKQFNSVWSVWVTEFTRDIKPIEDINLEEDMFTVLQDLGIEWAQINYSKHSSKYKNISEIGDYFHYVNLKKNQNVLIQAAQTVRNYFRDSLPYEEQQLIRSLIDNVEQQTIDIIKSKPVATRGYSPTYLQEVAKNVKEKVTEFESKRKYTLKKDFTVDLLLYVFDKAGSWISDSYNKFRKSNDALTYLESKKMQYYNIFRSFYKGNSSAVVLGELICEKLKVSSVEAVCNKTAIDLTGEIRCSFPAFNGNRLNLEKHVLTSLAEKEDFDDFINYIQRPRDQVESFIKEEVKKYIFTKYKAKALLKKNVEDINKPVSQALFDATEKIKTQGGNTDMWLKEFSSLIKDELTFDAISSENFSDINKFDFLKEEIEKGLTSIIKELNRLSLDKMKEFRLKPDQILIDQLCNCCWVTCPFCSAVCTNTIKDHSPEKHSVPFHRSPAVNGCHFQDTDEMSIEFCTTKVASDMHFYIRVDPDETIPYKQYWTGGPEYASWRIDHDEYKLTYWKWFVCRFQVQLEDHYKYKFQGRGEIPYEWRTHSKEEAIKSLDEMCQ